MKLAVNYDNKFRIMLFKSYNEDFMLSDSNAKNSNMLAMLFMAVNAVSLGSLYAVMKCITYSVNSNQATFLYKSIIFLFLLPWIFYKDGLSVIKTPNIKIHLLRSVFSAGGSLSMMYSLKFLNLRRHSAYTYRTGVMDYYRCCIF